MDLSNLNYHEIYALREKVNEVFVKLSKEEAEKIKSMPLTTKEGVERAREKMDENMYTSVEKYELFKYLNKCEEELNKK